MQLEDVIKELSIVITHLEKHLKSNTISHNKVREIAALWLDKIKNSSEENLPAEKFNLTPRYIHRELDRFVYGQQQAKSLLAVNSYTHILKKRIIEDHPEKGPFKKSNILLVGNSGVGKTLLVQTLAKILEAPFVTVDLTNYSATGYVGLDVEKIPRLLYNAAGKSKEKTEKGIILLDEADKIAINNQTTVNKSDVQSSLLKLIEGHEYDCSGDAIDTSKILFIVAGAFPGIDKIIEKRANTAGSTMGFKGTVLKNKNKQEILAEDLISYGMMGELIGRLPNIVQLDDLTVADLVSIMTSVEGSDLAEYKELFSHFGMTLKCHNKALEYIAQKALNRKLGARSLRSILDKIFLPIVYEAPNRDCRDLTIRVTLKFVKTMLGE